MIDAIFGFIIEFVFFTLQTCKQMADKYRRIEKTQEALPSNEIRVKRGVGIGRYLKRAHELLSGADGSSDNVIIKGVSNAVESAVKLAELIKHRIKGLHQLNRISHITIVDEYEPLEEGLDQLKFTRIVTMLEIVLSKKNLDSKDVGYQEPIDESEVQEYSERQEGEGEDGERRRARRRGARGGRGGRGRGGRSRGGRPEATPRDEGQLQDGAEN
jgi:DNA-binding protein